MPLDSEVTKLLTECDLPSTGNLTEKRKRIMMFFGARHGVDEQRERATNNEAADKKPAGDEAAGDEAARKEAGCS